MERHTLIVTKTSKTIERFQRPLNEHPVLNRLAPVELDAACRFAWNSLPLGNPIGDPLIFYRHLTRN